MDEAGEPDRDPPRSAFTRTVDFFAWAGVAALLVPTLLVCADIVWRRAVGGAFVDVYDITQMCLVACAAWTIPYGFIHGTHINMDLLVSRMPAGVQAALEAIIHLASALLFALLFWLAWNATQLHYGYGDTTQNLGIPVTWYWLIFLIGLGLSTLACLWRVRRALAGRRASTAGVPR